VASKVKIEMSNFKIVLGVLVLGTFAAAVHAECIVADPTPTLLNARSAPYGRIIGTLDNGQLVSILDSASDGRGAPWVYVADAEGTPIGWVYRSYIVCKGETR
jgi:hypothetical protein